MVLLHEGLGCVAMWRDFPEQINTAMGCGVFVYSRFGYGGSSAAVLPRPVSYMHDEALVVLPELLAKLAADQGSRDVVLVGHSDGASISLIHSGGAAALATPSPVVAQILLAPHVFNEQVCINSIQLARQAFEQGDLRSRLARYHGANVDIAFRGWNDVWLSTPFQKWNIERYLPATEVPTLLLQGDADEYGTLAQVHAIQHGLTAPVDTHILAGCGHAPHQQAGQQVTQSDD